MPNFGIFFFLFTREFLRSLEVVFDLCEKGLVRIMGDGNAFAE